MFSRIEIERVVKKKNFVWFESKKNYDLNIVGVRNTAVGKQVTNKFDDWITVSYKINGVWQFHIWSCTTDPGLYYTTTELLSPGGVARLVPGQYRNSHKIGLHQGRYPALVQNAPVSVYRDNNRDRQFNESKIETGFFGINIHRSSATGTSIQIDKWSAGCQVFANINDFTRFMRIAENARSVFGNRFSYTLIESRDIGA